jgi:hypothetical protein
MRRLCVTVLFCLLPVALSAQGIASYNLRVYPAGSATATTSLNVPVASISCNQAPVAGVNVENPTTWRWSDPTNAGRDCVFTDAARFTALPDGSFEGTVQALNADGPSAETARVPFTRRRPAPPAVPTNPRITQ